MKTESIDKFGLRFVVVEPASIGLEKHSTHCFHDDEPTLEWWCRGIKPGDIVVDAGACFGSYTLPALAAGASVIAYEPSDDGVAILRANLAANGWLANTYHALRPGRCLVRKGVLWAKDGSPYPEGLARLVFGNRYQTINWQTGSLDDDLAQICIDRIDHLKSDVEGAELGLLRGAVQTIGDFRPRLLIEDHESVSPDPNDEVSRYPERIGSSAAIHAMLRDWGYSVEVVRQDVSRRYIVGEVRR